jgi:peptidoglycan/LPS O-acetylase OafA/YrhL
MMTAPASERIPVLDGVRGLALLIVVVHNTAWISGVSDRFAFKLYTSAAAAGWAGVQLFFVLSGFLITGILLDTQDAPDYFRRFYVRRTLRIFPLYFLLLAVAVFVVAPLQRNAPWAQSVRSYQWTYWLYVSNWTEPYGYSVHGLSHLWSLAVEEQFYLIWPLVVWWLGARRLMWLSVAIVVAGPAVRWAMHLSGLPQSALYSFTVARCDALAMGALLAIAVRHAALRATVVRWLPAVTAVTFTALLLLIAKQRGFHGHELEIQIAGQSITAMLSACLIAWTLPQQHGRASACVRRLLELPALREIGNRSYAMYLIHVPVHVFAMPLFTRWLQAPDDLWHLPRLLLYTALVLFIAYVGARMTWRWIEKPALTLKERLAPA